MNMFNKYFFNLSGQEMAVTNLHTFGWSKETCLKERIEAHLNEPITKTNSRYDTFDFTSDSYVIELKSRRGKDKNRKPVVYSTYPDWLVPCSKTINLEEKDIIFFYYFEGDDSLWFLKYDYNLFETFPREIPFWHPTSQEHFYIPREYFTRVELPDNPQPVLNDETS